MKTVNLSLDFAFDVYVKANTLDTNKVFWEVKSVDSDIVKFKSVDSSPLTDGVVIARFAFEADGLEGQDVANALSESKSMVIEALYNLKIETE